MGKLESTTKPGRISGDYYTIEGMRTLTDLKHAPMAIQDKYGNIMLVQSFSVIRNLANADDMIVLGVKPIICDK
jgi:hypothetical protein